VFSTCIGDTVASYCFFSFKSSSLEITVEVVVVVAVDVVDVVVDVSGSFKIGSCFVCPFVISSSLASIAALQIGQVLCCFNQVSTQVKSKI